eukprot:123587_1
MIRSLHNTTATKSITFNRSESKRTIYAVKEGYIWKKGSKSFHSFRNRYIILWSNKRIEYYTDDTLSELKGSVNLNDLHRRFIQRSDKIPKKRQSMHGFKIITKKRTWYFSVHDAQQRDEWIQNIRDTVDEKTSPIPATPTPTTVAIASPSLLASKIHKIQSQKKAQWNQLMAEQRIKAMYPDKIDTNVETKPCRKSKKTLKIYRDREVDSNKQTEQGENNTRRFDDETEQKQKDTLTTPSGEAHNTSYDSEGSTLGFSLSTTPIVDPPTSPNIMRQMSNLYVSHTELTDFWNLNSHPCVELSDNVLNGIYCTKFKATQWVSCFGTKIVANGGRKQWRIKICSRDHGRMGQIANVVIGISDADIVKQRGGTYDGGFWNNEPYFGYGFSGYSGRNVKGCVSEEYGQKYMVGDVITVSLDLGKKEVVFMCNHKNYGVAFEVDDKRRYILGVALCNNLYDLQICECD